MKYVNLLFMHVDISSLYFLSCDLSILHCWCRENMEFECAFHCPRKHIISLPGRIRQIKQLSTQLTKFFQESFWDLICWLKAEDNGIMLWWIFFFFRWVHLFFWKWHPCISQSILYPLLRDSTWVTNRRWPNVSYTSICIVIFISCQK